MSDTCVTSIYIRISGTWGLYLGIPYRDARRALPPNCNLAMQDLGPGFRVSVGQLRGNRLESPAHVLANANVRFRGLTDAQGSLHHQVPFYVHVLTAMGLSGLTENEKRNIRERLSAR